VVRRQAAIYSRVRVEDVIPLRIGGRRPRHCLFFITVEFADAEPELYVVPVTTVGFDEADDDTTIALVDTNHGPMRFVASVADGQLSHAMFEILRRGLTVSGENGQIIGRPTRPARTMSLRPADIPARAINAEQSNTSVVFGDVAITKLIRRIETGINPDAELSRHLTEQGYVHTPQFLGAIEYEAPGLPPATLLLASSFVPNEGDEWKTTLDEMARLLEIAVVHPLVSADWPALALGSDQRETPPAWLNESANHLFARAQLLGERTADLHWALSDSDAADFRPEAFTRLYQRSLYQALRGETRETMRRLRRASLQGRALDLANEVFAADDVIMREFTRLTGELMEAARIRIHGDLHLGQVLASGHDVTFIDFEGEPARPLASAVSNGRHCVMWRASSGPTTTRRAKPFDRPSTAASSRGWQRAGLHNPRHTHRRVGRLRVLGRLPTTRERQRVPAAQHGPHTAAAGSAYCCKR